MFVFILLSVCLCASASNPYFAPEQASEYFEEFIRKFEKQYADVHEKAFRFEIFKANLEKVNQMNRENEHAEFGITQFLDLTPEEFSQRYTGLQRLSSETILCPTVLYNDDIPDANAPESFDWREKSAVTRVKDQGHCGGCFAFSVTGTIEGQNAIKHKTLVELSEQQIIDCDKKADGCNGGVMSTSLVSLKEMGGSMTESDYPYKASDGTCAFDISKVAVKLSDCLSYNLTSQEKVKQALFKNGPISIGIKAHALHGYVNGIISTKACKVGRLSHAVLLVGYGAENNVPYWIVKNSWATSFGEDGYFRMERSEDVEGACGMLNGAMASAVVE